MKYLNILIVICFILSGCKKVTIEPEIINLKGITKNRFNFNVTPTRIQNQEEIIQQLAIGITRDDAISIALQNYPLLQAKFDELGIAKSDLVQSGLFTNPELHTIFQFPITDSKVQTDVGLAFTLSDLWQIPLRRAVFADELEIMSLSVLRMIIDTIAHTRKAYDAILFSKAELKKAKEIYNQVIALRNDIYDRQKFGFTTDLDKSLADINVANWKLEIQKIENELKNNLIHLQTMLGLYPAGRAPSENNILLKTSLETSVSQIPEPSLRGAPLLERWAFENRPEIQIALMRIKKAEDLVAFEKIRKVKRVELDPADFQRDFEGNIGIGPNLKLDVPLFDQNQAQIAKAEFQVCKARKKYVAWQNKIAEEVRIAYNNLETVLLQATVYKKEMFPANKIALKYTLTYYPVMQITLPTVIQTQILLYENEKRYISKQLEILNALTELERAIGKKIDLTDKLIK